MDDSTSILISILRQSLLSGGADSVINIWDLETESHDQETAVIDTLATIPQYSFHFVTFLMEGIRDMNLQLPPSDGGLLIRECSLQLHLTSTSKSGILILLKYSLTSHT